ncbi:hypothetical protein NKH18_45750 [Streptomyces sp. M10(2022)]
MPAEALTSTVERFNGFARTGKDTEFGRGTAPTTATTETRR